MTEKAALKDKLESPAQLSVSDGHLESYPTLVGAMKSWHRLLEEDKAVAVIWCDGETYERAEIEEVDAAV